MTSKKQWLQERLLVPAGILPPAIMHEDLKFYENIRGKIGNAGFEYFLLCHQSSQKINDSPLSGKIFALHAPWPGEFSHNTLSNPIIRKIAQKIMYPPGTKISDDFEEMSEVSFKFASEIGARVVTVHIGFFDHNKLARQLEHLANLEKKHSVIASIEHEPGLSLKSPASKSFLTINGSNDWVLNPSEILKVTDAHFPSHQFGITLDSAALIARQVDLVQTAKSIAGRISHVHLANDETGEELATDVNRPDIKDLVSYLFESNYKGFITTEVNGAVGSKETWIARIYGASSILGLKILQPEFFDNVHRHFASSCNYLLDGLK